MGCGQTSIFAIRKWRRTRRLYFRIACAAAGAGGLRCVSCACWAGLHAARTGGCLCGVEAGAAVSVEGSVEGGTKRYALPCELQSRRVGGST